MIKELLCKWFGIELICPTCEVLKEQLKVEQQFNKVLFDKLITPAIPDPTPAINNPQVPLRKAMSFRQAVKEREEQDAIAARKLKSIDELEKELKIKAEEVPEGLQLTVEKD